ncbi:hypothetical protein BHS06_01900 [Myxococcus xanthus]|nr:hypothetical protein BHS06_01900 [Myxococcus xanthus]
MGTLRRGTASTGLAPFQSPRWMALEKTVCAKPRRLLTDLGDRSAAAESASSMRAVVTSASANAPRRGRRCFSAASRSPWERSCPAKFCAYQSSSSPKVRETGTSMGSSPRRWNSALRSNSRASSWAASFVAQLVRRCTHRPAPFFHFTTQEPSRLKMLAMVKPP